MARRGEIYHVGWSAGRGAEQAGVRPALIIQNDVGNQFSPTTIVAAITSQPRRRRYPFHVAFTSEESGLRLDGTVLCEQVQTIDQSRLGRMAGALPPRRMLEVDAALHRSLGLED